MRVAYFRWQIKFTAAAGLALSAQVHWRSGTLEKIVVDTLPSPRYFRGEGSGGEGPWKAELSMQFQVREYRYSQITPVAYGSPWRLPDEPVYQTIQVVQSVATCCHG